MFKLTVVSGPNRGAAYAIRDGEVTIGRQAGNVIVLSSAKVSKRHCVLLVSGDEITVQDQGSSNGTFVNGSLAKERRVKPGDRISVGEFVMELSAPPAKVSKSVPVALAGMANVLDFPAPAARRPQPQAASASSAFPSAGGGVDPLAASGSIASTQTVPRDLKGRVLWAFEHYVMPFFYGLNLKSEWRMIAAGLFSVAILASVVFSVYPLLETSRGMVVREVGRRAKFMARQLAEINAPFVASRAESRVELGMVEGADGVRMAVVADLDGRIIAPASRLNHYLVTGSAAALSKRAAAAFRNGKESGLMMEVGEGTLVAIEPLRATVPSTGRHAVVGMAVVSMDTSLATLQMGEAGNVYSQALILSGVFGLLIAFVLYRLTLRPFQVLNEDMDKVLKGDMAQVTREFKIEELAPLWDIINSTLQRVSHGGEGARSAAGVDSGPTAEDYVGPLRSVASAVNAGLVVLGSDHKIIYLNPLFEEISGIRGDSAIGQELSEVARDQALGAIVSDLFSRAITGGEAMAENFDFSGISYRVQIEALGKRGEAARCYALLAVKNG
ncbi:MAG: FHA domain-containing protein [Oligoflexia bacterium]|nr:FHA domain-containing protein [Oligoflexia bacterium]